MRVEYYLNLSEVGSDEQKNIDNLKKTRHNRCRKRNHTDSDESPEEQIRLLEIQKRPGKTKKKILSSMYYNVKRVYFLKNSNNIISLLFKIVCIF